MTDQNVSRNTARVSGYLNLEPTGCFYQRLVIEAPYQQTITQEMWAIRLTFGYGRPS